MKKGFTLVELLAVIAILAILVIIALPNVMGMFNDAKKNSFTTEVKEVFKLAQQEWMSDSMFSTADRSYARNKSNSCSNKLDLSGREELEYFIKINKAGKVVEYYATDGTYQYSYKGVGLNIEDIQNVLQVSTITNGKYLNITCNSGKISSPPPENPGDYFMTGSAGAETTNYLGTAIKRQDIETITFVNSTSGHSANGTNCWDVSAGGTGNVLAWTTDTNNDGLYEFTIGSNNDIFATDASWMFSNLINLKAIYGLENFNTSQVTNMARMFNNCYNLETVDVSGFDTSNTTSMNFMFSAAKKLRTLDVSNFDTSKVTNFSYMFNDCESLTSINVSNFDTSKATTMAGMFSSDYSLTSLDLGNFDTTLVSDFGSMFRSSRNLVSINLSSFDTSNASFLGYMFSGCESLKKIDVRNFDTSKAQKIWYMFHKCTSLETLDLSSFDTSEVVNMQNMFQDSNKLKTIYVSNKFTLPKVSTSELTFSGCTSLVGGAGTTYNSSNPKDKTYAHIDGGASNPGYFTSK